LDLYTKLDVAATTPKQDVGQPTLVDLSRKLGAMYNTSVSISFDIDRDTYIISSHGMATTLSNLEFGQAVSQESLIASVVQRHAEVYDKPF
jgi:hypothetical protein